MSTQKKTLYGEIALLTAIIVNSFALGFFVKADFGVSTLSSVPLVLSIVNSNISLGTWTIIVQVAVILIMSIWTKKFKVSYLLSFIVSIFFGMSVDFASYVLAALPTNMLLRILYFAIGLASMPFGAAMFLLCKLPILPFDLFVRVIHDYTGKSIQFVRTAYDAVFISISLLLCLLVLKEIVGIGIGSVICMFSTGRITQFYYNNILDSYTVKVKTKFAQKLATI